MTTPVKMPKGPYSELEAAEALGLELDDFRRLIREHIVDREEDLNNLSVATFQASDLLVLRLILAKHQH